MSGPRGLVCLIAAAGTLLIGSPAEAKILKTRRIQQLTNSLTIGSGLEYESDAEHTQYDHPLLIEYAITEALNVTAEPNYVVFRSKTEEPSVSGWGDLETSVTWEMTDETRRRPAFSTEAAIKWPTASSDQLASGQTDYSMGLILSKSFGSATFDANAIYTLVGRPPGAGNLDTVEGSLAMEWALTRLLDVEGEVVTSSGGITGRTGTTSGFGVRAEGASSETAFTLGLAEHLFGHLKIEEGGIMKSDGSFQLVGAWEWEFGRGD